MTSSTIVIISFFTLVLAASSINGKSIRELMNSKVIQAQLVGRAKRTGNGYDHHGVVVTTYNGDRWLVHKGHNFSKFGDTVVTSAFHMSRRWKVFDIKKVKGVTVADYVEAGGRYFHPVHDNALHAAKRMMKLGSKKHL